MAVYAPNTKINAGNKAFTDPEGLTVRSYGLGQPNAVTGTSSGYTRTGQRVSADGSVSGRVDPTKARAGAGGGSWGGAPHTAPPVPGAPYDPAAAAAATAASGAQARAAAGAAGAAPPAAGGSESGPGILENWFNQRAAGIDSAYEYAMKRGGDAIDNRMAAGGSYNSGARGQQLSDYAANMGAQRMGQLDALAGGASGEHLGRLGLMFNQGLGLAGGMAGLSSAYDLGAAGNMDAATRAQMMLALNRMGVDTKGNQGALDFFTSIYGAGKAGQ